MNAPGIKHLGWIHRVIVLAIHKKTFEKCRGYVSDNASTLPQELGLYGYALVVNGSNYLPKDFKSHQHSLVEYMNKLHSTNKVQIVKMVLPL